MSSPPKAATPMIRMIGVHKRFGSLPVLRNINLEVARGEVVVVLGPSGSGKSTLCRTINRLEPIDSGTIRLDGVDLPVEGRALTRLWRAPPPGAECRPESMKRTAPPRRTGSAASWGSGRRPRTRPRDRCFGRNSG